MEYGLVVLVGVIVSFVSWCVGVRMGSNYVAKRMIEEFGEKR
jgi:hypothetical protein